VQNLRAVDRYVWTKGGAEEATVSTWRGKGDDDAFVAGIRIPFKPNRLVNGELARVDLSAAAAASHPAARRSREVEPVAG
jgi:hypothetical protein